MKNRYKFGILGLIVVLVLALVGIGSMTGANAARPVMNPPCTETVHHPAETHEEEIFHPEEFHFETVVVSEEVPGVWANWAPNNTQGPQDYVPVWPSDERGTWIVHEQGVPPGHEGPDGVYQQGAGNSPWFYRQAAVPEVTKEVKVVDKEAWTETITVVDKEAYDEEVEVPCEEPEQPEPLVEEKSTSSYECGDDFESVTTETTTTEYILVEGEWVLGQPITKITHSKNPVEVVPCEEKPEEPEKPGNPDEPNKPVSNPPAPQAPEAPAPQKKAPQIPFSVDAGI